MPGAGKGHLAAGWAWQSLTERQAFGKGFVVHPAGLLDEFAPVIADVGYRSAEGRESQPSIGADEVAS